MPISEILQKVLGLPASDDKTFGEYCMHRYRTIFEETLAANPSANPDDLATARQRRCLAKIDTEYLFSLEPTALRALYEEIMSLPAYETDIVTAIFSPLVGLIDSHKELHKKAQADAQRYSKLPLSEQGKQLPRVIVETLGLQHGNQESLIQYMLSLYLNAFTTLCQHNTEAISSDVLLSYLISVLQPVVEDLSESQLVQLDAELKTLAFISNDEDNNKLPEYSQATTDPKKLTGNNLLLFKGDNGLLFGGVRDTRKPGYLIKATEKPTLENIGQFELGERSEGIYIFFEEQLYCYDSSQKELRCIGKAPFDVPETIEQNNTRKIPLLLDFIMAIETHLEFSHPDSIHTFPIDSDLLVPNISSDKLIELFQTNPDVARATYLQPIKIMARQHGLPAGIPKHGLLDNAITNIEIAMGYAVRAKRCRPLQVQVRQLLSEVDREEPEKKLSTLNDALTVVQKLLLINGITPVLDYIPDIANTVESISAVDKLITQRDSALKQCLLAFDQQSTQITSSTEALSTASQAQLSLKTLNTLLEEGEALLRTAAQSEKRENPRSKKIKTLLENANHMLRDRQTIERALDNSDQAIEETTKLQSLCLICQEYLDNIKAEENANPALATLAPIPHTSEFTENDKTKPQTLLDQKRAVVKVLMDTLRDPNLPFSDKIKEFNKQLNDKHTAAIIDKSITSGEWFHKRLQYVGERIFGQEKGAYAHHSSTIKKRVEQIIPPENQRRTRQKPLFSIFNLGRLSSTRSKLGRATMPTDTYPDISPVLQGFLQQPSIDGQDFLVYWSTADMASLTRKVEALEDRDLLLRILPEIDAWYNRVPASPSGDNHEPATNLQTYKAALLARLKSLLPTNDDVEKMHTELTRSVDSKTRECLEELAIPDTGTGDLENITRAKRRLQEAKDSQVVLKGLQLFIGNHLETSEKTESTKPTKFSWFSRTPQDPLSKKRQLKSQADLAIVENEKLLAETDILYALNVQCLEYLIKIDAEEKNAPTLKAIKLEKGNVEESAETSQPTTLWEQKRRVINTLLGHIHAKDQSFEQKINKFKTDLEKPNHAKVLDKSTSWGEWWSKGIQEIFGKLRAYFEQKPAWESRVASLQAALKKAESPTPPTTPDASDDGHEDPEQHTPS